MMSEKPSEEEIARVRARGRELLDSLRDDPEFAEQVRKDPTGALVARGIPEAAAQEWQKPRGEVSGYDDDCSYSCGYTSTGSDGSCFDSCYASAYY